MNKQKISKSKWMLIGGVVALALAVGLTSGSRLLSGRPAAQGAQVLVPTQAQSRAGIPGVVNVDFTKMPAATQQDMQTLQNLQDAFRVMAAKVLPSVVQVNVVDMVKQSAPTSPFNFFFGPQNGKPREFRQQGLGSGVIVRRSGDTYYVLTNNHVAGDATQISVQLPDGRSYKAKLVGKDENRDLALVQFQTREDIPVAELGDSNTLRVGDIVMAVGSPLGFESTVTEGIVSAIGRRSVQGVGGFTDYIQTDAPINQGNSGGALVNIYGQVIGLNAWIASTSGGNVGLGFAIPINNAKRDIQDFITKGKAQYGWIGINMGSLQPQAAKDLNLPNAQGAFVYGIFRGSPADKAGILPGDMITAINEQKLKDSTDLLVAVGNMNPGSTATLDIDRDGTPMNISLKVGSRADQKQLEAEANKVWPGFSVVKITADIRQQLNLGNTTADLVIGAVDQGGPANVAGLQAGDLVTKVNGKAVNSLGEFYKDLNAPGNEVMFTIQRQDTTLIIGLVR
jgi:Do/DeqQ family serine protease